MLSRLFRKKGPSEQRAAGLVVGSDVVSYVRIRFDEASIVIEQTEVQNVRGSVPDALAAVAARVAQEHRAVITLVGHDLLRLEEFELRRGNDLRETLDLEVMRVDRFKSREQRVLVPAGGEIDTERRVIGFADVEGVSAFVGPIEAAGFDVIAIDYEGCAWRRVAPNADVLAIFSDAGAVLWGFGSPTIKLRTKERRSTVLDARSTRLFLDQIIQEINLFSHDGVIEQAETISVLGPEAFVSALQSHEKVAGVEVSPVSVGTVVQPAWALAYGAATYMVDETLHGETAYAF